jgi:hypothetical protein
MVVLRENEGGGGRAIFCSRKFSYSPRAYPPKGVAAWMVTPYLYGKSDNYSFWNPDMPAWILLWKQTCVCLQNSQKPEQRMRVRQSRLYLEGG